MHGYGVFTWPDGRKYEGEYVNDHKVGQGSFYWPNGRIYKGGWKDGKMEGKATYTSESGRIRVGLWKNGKRVQWLENKHDDHSKSAMHFENL